MQWDTSDHLFNWPKVSYEVKKLFAAIKSKPGALYVSRY